MFFTKHRVPYQSIILEHAFILELFLFIPKIMSYKINMCIIDLCGTFSYFSIRNKIFLKYNNP